MSRTKAVRIRDRDVWVLDSSHDVVVARMVEEADRLDAVDAATLQSWRVCASVADLAFHQEGPILPTLAEVLAGARAQITQHGDVHRSDLASWHLIDNIPVSGGNLRYDPLPVDALLDVLDGFADLFAETMDPDPPRAWWFLGVPGGRQTIEMRDGDLGKP